MRTSRLRNLLWIAAGVLAVGAAAWALRPGAREVAADEQQPARELPAAENPWEAPQEPTWSAMRYTRFETLGVADGLPSDRVSCVLAEGDDLYVGTDQGLAVRRGGAWSVLGPEQGLSHRYVTSVSRDPVTDTTWVSTLRGISRVSGGDVRVYTQLDSGLMNDVVYQLQVDGDLVWCATAAGVSALDTRSGTWTLYDQENSIMHEPWAYTLVATPPRTWVGMWGGCLTELDRRTGRWREYRDPDKEMEIDLLPDDGPIHEVTSFIAYAEGVLWQASYFGLARYDGRRWRSYTAADSGLPGDFISHIAARGHTAWIGSDQGLGVMRGDEVVSYRRQEDGTCRVRLVRGGEEAESWTLPTAPGDDYILWTHPRERDVWIATGHGLSHGIAQE